MNGPVLVTGATGNTGKVVTELLRNTGADVRTAGRRPGPGGVRFDWAEPATHAAALHGVQRMYLVAPVGVAEPAPLVRAFLDRGLAEGLRRVVLLSSSAVPASAGGLGALHGLVRDTAPEWAVLRPSWFMQNLVGDHPVAAGLRAGQVVTATGEGRVAFVDAADIAAVATRLLLDETPPHGEYVVTGPEAVGYAEVCALVGRLTGRRIEHVSVPPAQLAERIAAVGVPAEFAGLLAAMDDDIRHGSEDRTTTTVAEVTGRDPRSLADFLAAHLPALAAPA